MSQQGKQPRLEDDVLLKTQFGLLFSKPKYGIYVNCFYKGGLNVNDPAVQGGILDAVRNVIKYALELDKAAGGEARTRAVVGFNPDQWSEWYKNDPQLANLDRRPPGKRLVPDSQKFLDTGGDVFFLLKSDVQGEVEKVHDRVEKKMRSYCDRMDATHSQPPSNRVLQNSFQDGVANPSDGASIKNYILKNNGALSGHPGSTYLLSQKFEFNWAVLGNMDKIQKEDMIGRKSGTDAFIPHTDKRAHISRVHVELDVPPVNSLLRHKRVFRVSMPYGHVENYPSREEGLMYMHMCNTTEVFTTILKSIAGDDKHAKLGDVTVDSLISAVRPIQGTFWYVPSADELSLSRHKEPRFELVEFWNVRNPSNDYLFYNHKEYLHRMTTGGYTPGDPPSDRVLGLLDYAFSQWDDQWFKKREMPKVPHLFTMFKSERKLNTIKNSSIMLRKGWAIKVSLGRLFTTNKIPKLQRESFFGRKADFFNIHPDEIIVGRMPKCFSLGLGRAAMPYFTDDEQIPAFYKGLSEGAGMGHVVPDHERLVQKGLGRMLEELKADKGKTVKEHEFITSCIYALEGVQKYIRNFGVLARYCAENSGFAISEAQKQNLREIEARMNKISTDRPQTFVEAAQLVFSYHTCLHLTCEPVSIGRLDQILAPFLPGTSAEDAQEIIDCFFVKMCEHANLNSRLLNDIHIWGIGAVSYSSTGGFQCGNSINQWVQQVTVGGYKANEAKVPEDGCNDVTMMCLKASRRLPLTAPCLSLRVHKNMPQQFLEEAAKVVLSGGAHPVLPHDDYLVPGLKSAGTKDAPVSLTSARNYCCDGCYEPMFPGETDFALSTVSLLQVLEMAINHGATYARAGSGTLDGTPQSLPTKHPEDIQDFEELKDIFSKHLYIRTGYTLFGMLSKYNQIVQFCPSPLLSNLIRGCVETKRDIYDGGANHSMIGVQFIPIANTVDALYAIKRLVFDHDSAMISLAELVRCLKCDWGFNMKEPFHDEIAGATRGQRLSDTYKEVRERALKLPKFGTSAGEENKDIQEITSWLVDKCLAVVNEVARDNPRAHRPLVELIDGLKKKYSVPGAPWDILLPIGAGSFGSYVPAGGGCGASADGRRSGAPLASDFGAAPTPQDLPPTPKSFEIYKSLKSWDLPSIKVGFNDGAEIGLKIMENFKEEELVEFLRKFADQKGVGGNILTITTADPNTLANAQRNPEKYDLIRTRIGGWGDFYVSVFSAHQKQHERRIYYHTE